MSTLEHPRVCVVGLGYVGLTLATVLAESGLRVYGLERLPDVVRSTNDAVPHFTEVGLADALAAVVGSGRLSAHVSLDGIEPCDVYIITVGTPLDANGDARLDMIRAASAEVASHMADGALVIVRSTVKVGATRSVVAPVLGSSGKIFDVAMCPERTLEGRALIELRELPQIVGADHKVVRTRAAELFSRFARTTIEVDSPETAEVIKLVDNTYRDVRFAFANEVARACEAFGVSATQVIASGKLGYPRTDVAIPGLVGGPCLEKDPHILWQSASEAGVDLEMTRTARLINERQPSETAGEILEEVRRRGLGDRPRIAILGAAFKGVPATDDLRGSMAVHVKDALLAAFPAAAVTVFDPVVPIEALAARFAGTEVAATVEDAVRGASIAVITNNHPLFGTYPPERLLGLMASGAFVYDYWNLFSHLDARLRGRDYLAVGSVSARFS